MNEHHVQFIYDPETGKGHYEEIGVIEQHFDALGNVETFRVAFLNLNRTVYNLLEVAFFPLIESLVIGLTRIIRKLADWLED